MRLYSAGVTSNVSVFFSNLLSLLKKILEKACLGNMLLEIQLENNY